MRRYGLLRFIHFFEECFRLRSAASSCSFPAVACCCGAAACPGFCPVPDRNLRSSGFLRPVRLVEGHDDPPLLPVTDHQIVQIEQTVRYDDFLLRFGIGFRGGSNHLTGRRSGKPLPAVRTAASCPGSPTLCRTALHRASCRERPDVTDTATATAIDSAAGADSDTGTDSGADSSASTGSGSATGADATTSTGSGSGSVTADAETGFTEGADSGTAADTPADSPKASGIAAGSGRESRTAPPANRPGRYLFRTPAQLRRRTAAQRRTRKRRNPLRRNSQTVSLHTIFLSLSKTKSRSMPGTSVRTRPAHRPSSIKRAKFFLYLVHLHNKIGLSEPKVRKISDAGNGLSADCQKFTDAARRLFSESEKLCISLLRMQNRTKKPSNGHRTRFAAYTHTKKNHPEMDILELRRYCLSLPLAEECTPFDENDPGLQKSGGKNVLLHRYGGIPMDRCKVRSGSGRSASRTLSGTGHSRFPQQQTPLERHPYDGDLPDAFIREQLRHSYLLVAAGITPKALRQEIRNQIEKAGLPEE